MIEGSFAAAAELLKLFNKFLNVPMERTTATTPRATSVRLVNGAKSGDSQDYRFASLTLPNVEMINRMRVVFLVPSF